MTEEKLLQFKKQAKLLRNAFEKRGQKMNHNAAIELLAESLGYRNYTTMQAAMVRLSASNSDEYFDLGQVLPEGYVPSYLNTKFIVAIGQARVVFDALPSNLGHWKRYGTKEPIPFNGIYFEHQSLEKPLLAISFYEDVAEAVRIVPVIGSPSMTPTEENLLETDFVNTVRDYLPKSVRIEQQPTRVHLHDRVSESTYRKFKYHSMNKSSGNLHSLDEKRWLEFVFEAAQEGIEATDENANLVFAALIGEGFPERHAKRMSLDFQTQIGAMQFCLKM